MTHHYLLLILPILVGLLWLNDRSRDRRIDEMKRRHQERKS